MMMVIVVGLGLGSERARGRVSTRRVRGRLVGTDSGSYAFDA